jgi:hypothetical protein
MRSERPIDERGVDAVDGTGNHPRMIFLCCIVPLDVEAALPALGPRERIRE